MRVCAWLAVAAVALTARPAWAWDELGHRVVARIAWDQMTPRARAAAVRVLMDAPETAGLRQLMPATGTDEERGRELFVMAAVWPDLIRTREHPGNRYAHSDWHYVNFFWEQKPDGSRVDRPDVPRAGELLHQLPRLDSVLAGPAPDSAKAVALAWVEHLVGDAHQPLHNSARITAQEPEGDRGGNLFLLAGLYPNSNLHAYWDALMGPVSPWRPQDRDEAAYVGGIAARVQAAYSPAWARRLLRAGAYEDWSREGERVARNTAYPSWLVRGQPAPPRYRGFAWNAAEPRVALAGYRLADMLNRALGS